MNTTIYNVVRTTICMPVTAGRPHVDVDIELLELLARRGLTQADCAAVLRVSPATLQRRLKMDRQCAEAWAAGSEARSAAAREAADAKIAAAAAEKQRGILLVEKAVGRSRFDRLTSVAQKRQLSIEEALRAAVGAYAAAHEDDRSIAGEVDPDGFSPAIPRRKKLRVSQNAVAIENQETRA